MTDELLVRLGRLEGVQDQVLASLVRIERDVVSQLRDLKGELRDLTTRVSALEAFKLRIGILATAVTAGCSGVGLFATDILHWFIGKH